MSDGNELQTSDAATGNVRRPTVVSSKTRASLDKTFRTHNFQQIFPFLAKINKLIAKFDILTICNNFLEFLLSKIAVT